MTRTVIEKITAFMLGGLAMGGIMQFVIPAKSMPRPSLWFVAAVLVFSGMFFIWRAAK